MLTGSKREVVVPFVVVAIHCIVCISSVLSQKLIFAFSTNSFSFLA
jgi:hypothetical protein